MLLPRTESKVASVEKKCSNTSRTCSSLQLEHLWDFFPSPKPATNSTDLTWAMREEWNEIDQGSIRQLIRSKICQDDVGSVSRPGVVIQVYQLPSIVSATRLWGYSMKSYYIRRLFFSSSNYVFEERLNHEDPPRFPHKSLHSVASLGGLCHGQDAREGDNPPGDQNHFVKKSPHFYISLYS